MSVVQPSAEIYPEYVEAIIISGPRKGEFIHLPVEEPELTVTEEAMLDDLIERSRLMTEDLRAIRQNMEAMIDDLREANGE